MKKATRGGTRQGSGAKPKYNEPTKTIAFSCPDFKNRTRQKFTKNAVR